MNTLTETAIICPYCGESINVLIDSSDCGQDYIEDCQVCCRPITLVIHTTDSDEPMVSAFSENDSP